MAVAFPEMAAPRRASQQSLKVEEGRGGVGGKVTDVAVAAPDDAILGDALRQAAATGMQGAKVAPGSVVTMGTPATQPKCPMPKATTGVGSGPDVIMASKPAPAMISAVSLAKTSELRRASKPMITLPPARP